MSGDPKSTESPEARKARLDAEDRALLRRVLAGEAAALSKLMERLHFLLERRCHKFTPKLAEHLDEIRGECWTTLGRWLDEGKLREAESLPYLAGRLWSQCSDAFLAARKQDRKLVPIVQELPTDEEGTPYWVERAMAESSCYESAEERLATHEEVEWLLSVRAKLSETDRATYDAEQRVLNGDAASLPAALGVNAETAWKRRQRMRKALIALAGQDGVVGILERADGARSRRRDAGKPREGGPEE